MELDRTFLEVWHGIGLWVHVRMRGLGASLLQDLSAEGIAC